MAIWTDEEKRFLAERWAAGDTYDQIADEMAERGMEPRTREELSQARFRLSLPARAAVGRPRTRRPTGARAGHVSPWTPERVETLARMWGAHSTPEIARALGGGISKNAVIGKARRMKFPGVPMEERVRRARLAQPARAPRQRVRSQKPAACVVRWWQAAKPAKPVRIEPTDPAAIAAAALLGAADAAERRRDQWRKQPRGAAVR